VCRVTAHWGQLRGIKIFTPIIINLLATNLKPQGPAGRRKMYKTLIELLGAIKKSPRLPQLFSTGLISVVKQLKIEHLSCGHKIICFSLIFFSFFSGFYCFSVHIFQWWKIQIENHFFYSGFAGDAGVLFW